MDMENLSKQSIDGEKDFEEKTSESFDILENIENNQDFKQQAYNEWYDKFGSKPESFFDSENLDSLKKISTDKRILFFSIAISSLNISPKMAEKYYSLFPEDKKAINIISSSNGGRPNTTREFNLFSITDTKQVKSNDQFAEMIERRKVAPDFVMNNFDFENYDNMKEKFGKASDSFWETFKEASSMHGMGDHILDTSEIFDEDFEKLTDEEKADFLRRSVAELHHTLLFDETFNSCFTKKRVEEERTRDSDLSKESWARGRHNPAHSMIYKTYQPTSVYDRDDSYFKYEMNITPEIGGAVEEYPFHKMLLKVLDKFKSETTNNEENVNVLVDFWNKNRNPIFGNAVADALSEQGSDLAANQLLKLLREEKVDKNALTAILYRLEFGNVGISEDGVKYLEKTYDLGEYNNPDYHARRLTSTGEVGVFDEEKELIKYFHLGDLSTPEKKARAKVLDFTYDTLFINKEGESEEEKEKRLKYLEEFKKNYYKIAEDKLFEETDVRLNNLSFKEQGWFMVSFNEADDNKKERMRFLVKSQGENGLKVFFSLEHGGQEMGDKILSLAENLDQQTAQAIFDKYVEVVNTANSTTEYLKENFGDENQEDVNKITENLLRSGKDLLVCFADDLENSKEVDVEDILKQLSGYRSDVLMFSTVFKELKPNIEDVKNLEFKRTMWENLTEDEKDEMLATVKQNWSGREQAGKEIIAYFENAIKNGKDNEYHILKKTDGDEDEIMAFMRYYPDEDFKDGKKHLHLHSINVDPVFRGSKIGGSFIEKSMKEKAEGNVIHGSVYPELPVGTFYVDKVGFNITGVFDDKEGKKFDLDITCDLEKNQKFVTKRKTEDEYEMSIDDFKKILDEQKEKSVGDLIQKKAEVVVFEMNPIEDSEELEKNIRGLLSGGYVGTRYSFDQEKEGERIYVFEKDKK